MNLHDKPPPDLPLKHETRPRGSNPQPVAAPTCRAGDIRRRESKVGGSIPEPNWELLLKLAERVAKAEINKYCWREVEGGVLPSGYDANSIAAEAVAELFRKRKGKRLAHGHRVLAKNLRRRVRKIVNRLHHRMENEFMISECDLDPINYEDGEVVGALELHAGPGPDAVEALMVKEEATEFEHFKQRVHRFLGRDRLLQQIFACHCAGLSKPKAMAAKLKIPVRLIQDLQRRLQRKVREFLTIETPKSPGTIRISTNYFALEPVYQQPLAA